MLAVTAGDGACGENSTQPTARVSQVAFGVPDTGAGAHHLHVPGFRFGLHYRDCPCALPPKTLIGLAP